MNLTIPTNESSDRAQLKDCSSVSQESAHVVNLTTPSNEISDGAPLTHNGKFSENSNVELWSALGVSVALNLLLLGSFVMNSRRQSASEVRSDEVYEVLTLRRS